MSAKLKDNQLNMSQRSAMTFTKAHKMKTRFVRWTALAIAFGVLTSAPALADAQTKVRVGNLNTGSDVGLFIAETRGYFKAEGLDVELMSFPTAAKMIVPLASGQLDVGGGSVSAGLYNAAERGIGIRIVADKGTSKPGHTFSALMVRNDLIASGRYKSFSDLKGMHIATAAFGTGNAATINAALKKGGLKYSDADMVDLGFADHIAAFANKRIDASMTSEPVATLIEKAGLAARVPGNDEIYPDHQTAVLLYAEEFAKTRPDIALKFMRGYLRGLRDYNDVLQNGTLSGPGADKIIQIMIDNTNVKDPALYRSIVSAALDPDGTVNVASLQSDLDFFSEQGLVSPKVKAANIVDMSFAKKAAADLGPYKRATQ